MRYGFVLPGGTAEQQLELALVAEARGWDGVFAWEGPYGVDPWSLLSAIAVKTTRIRLGTMLTPLPWRRPWKVASQAATLDDLSGGRAILSVGTGAVGSGSDPTDIKTKAELLDEGLDIMFALWRGEREYAGRHYTLRVPSHIPVKRRRRIPVWAVGAWNFPQSLRRAMRCDGLLPMPLDVNRRHRPLTHDDLHDIRTWMRDYGNVRRGYDVIVEGETPAEDPAESARITRAWGRAGATWWLDARWGRPIRDALHVSRERLEAGPPGTAR